MSTASEAQPLPAREPLRASRTQNVTLFLISMAAIAGLAELALSIINVSTLPVFLTHALKLPSLVGVSVAVFYLSEAVFNSPMGTFADRFGRRRMMVFGVTISIFTSIGTSFLRAPHNQSFIDTAPVVAAVLGMRLLDGLGAAMLWPAIFASIGDRVSSAKQASAMGVLNTMYMIGLAFGPKVGGYLNESLTPRLQHVFATRIAGHWTTRHLSEWAATKIELTSPIHYLPSFYSAAICFALAGGVAFLVAPRRSEQHAALAESGSTAHTDEAPFSLVALKSALRKVPILMGVAFVTFLGIGLIAPNVKLFAMWRFHMTENGFGNKLLIPALLIAIVAIPLGRVGDIWGKTKAIRLGMGICAVSLWAILLINSEWAVVVVGSLLGVGFVLAFPAYMALLSDLTDSDERAGVIGAVRMSQGVGAMIGSAVGSLLYVYVGHESPFFVAAVFLGIAFIAGLFFIHEQPKLASDNSTISSK